MFERGEQSPSRSAALLTEQERKETLQVLEDERCRLKNQLAETQGLLELLRATPATETDEERINECQEKITSLMREIEKTEAELKAQGAEWLKS